MSAIIHSFPASLRKEVPPDAIPIGRERTAWVFPDSPSTWGCLLVDDGGGMELVANGRKLDALRAAGKAVFAFNAEMRVVNRWPIDARDA